MGITMDRSAFTSIIQFIGEQLENWTVPAIEELIPRAVACWESEAYGGSTNDGLYLLSQNKKIVKDKKERRFKSKVRIYALQLLPVGYGGYGSLCTTASRKNLSCNKPGVCVAFSGNGLRPHVSNARQRRTSFLCEEPQFFAALLYRDLFLLQSQSYIDGWTAAVRLNCFTDIPWEQVFPWLFEAFPGIVFYDYTKEQIRMETGWGLPTNYTLTFSLHEGISWENYKAFILKGNRGAAPFLVTNYLKNKLPSEYKGVPVVDGDLDDLRYMDPVGSIAGMRLKGGLSKKKAADLPGWVLQ